VPVPKLSAELTAIIVDVLHETRIEMSYPRKNWLQLREFRARHHLDGGAEVHTFPWAGCWSLDVYGTPLSSIVAQSREAPGTNTVQGQGSQETHG